MKADQELIGYLQSRAYVFSQKSNEDSISIAAKTYYVGKADAFQEVLDIVLDAEAHYENN